MTDPRNSYQIPVGGRAGKIFPTGPIINVCQSRTCRREIGKGGSASRGRGAVTGAGSIRASARCAQAAITSRAATSPSTARVAAAVRQIG